MQFVVLQLRLYENGWQIMYFNTQLEKYLIFYDDKSTDFVTRSEIDGVNILFNFKATVAR